jgi:hypothetical protein
MAHQNRGAWMVIGRVQVLDYNRVRRVLLKHFLHAVEQGLQSLRKRIIRARLEHAALDQLEMAPTILHINQAVAGALQAGVNPQNALGHGHASKPMGTPQSRACRALERLDDLRGCGREGLSARRHEFLF